MRIASLLSRPLLTTLTTLSLVTACGGELETTGAGGSGGASSSEGGAGSSTGGTGGGDVGDTSPPVVVFTSPTDLASDVVLNANISATFDEAMNAGTISETTFILTQGSITVAGVVTYAGTVATLNPEINLLTNTDYAVTVTTDATDVAGNALAAAETWTFRTGTTEANGPAVVNLGTAGGFAILAKSGIDTIPQSVITGHVGVSPIDSTALTGFTLTLDGSGTFATSAQITGKAYAADYTSPTPANLTVAIGNMETAFTDAAGRTTPDFTELGAGEIGGLTLVPGLYKWGTGVLITTDVTLDGGPNDVWIFQIAGGITQAANIDVQLAGGALARNIFWQSAGAVALDTGAHLEGNVLSMTEITLATGASINGRLLSQTAVTLDVATVTQPTQ